MRQAYQKYTYITHPNNLPLEIDGNAKKRAQPLKKQQFNGNKGTINQESRSLLLKKITNNAHDLDNLKSVIPTQDVRKKSRPNSIKTFNANKENISSSGIQYLMQKTENLKNKHHKQKAHVGEFVPASTKRPERKHFTSINMQSSQPENLGTKNNRKTIEMKLANDLYSDIFREEKDIGHTKKVQTSNLFRNGEDLGLQKKREVRLSENKLVQILGSECLRQQKGPLRQRRQDWRKSSINFF